METGTESSLLGKWESAWGLDVALGAEGRLGSALMIFMKPGKRSSPGSSAEGEDVRTGVMLVSAG